MYLHARTVIVSEDLQSSPPRTIRDIVTIPNRPSFYFTGHYEFKLPNIRRCRDPDWRKCVREVDRGRKDPIIHFNQGGVLVTDEVLKLGTRGFENLNDGQVDRFVELKNIRLCIFFSHQEDHTAPKSRWPLYYPFRPKRLPATREDVRILQELDESNQPPQKLCSYRLHLGRMNEGAPDYRREYAST